MRLLCVFSSYRLNTGYYKRIVAILRRAEVKFHRDGYKTKNNPKDSVSCFITHYSLRYDVSLTCDWEMPYELACKATCTFLRGCTNVRTVRLTQNLQ